MIARRKNFQRVSDLREVSTRLGQTASYFHEEVRARVA